MKKSSPITIGSLQWRLCSLLTTITIVAAGCSANSGKAENEATKPTEKQPDPVTIVFKHVSGDFDRLGDGYFNKEFALPIKQKFPHITATLSSGNLTANSVTAGEPLDILIGSPSVSGILAAMDFKLQSDLEPLVKQYKLDLNRLDPTTIDAAKQISGGALQLLPLYVAHQAPIYYNKDIFDKFGVAYPKDGMTWDDVYELAKKLTREEGGVQYYGLVLSPGHYMLRNQLSINMVDPTSMNLQIGTDSVKNLVQNLARFYQLPSYNPTAALLGGGRQGDLFVKSKTAAMYPTPNNPLYAPEDLQGINWDLASYPQWGQMKGVGPQVYTYFMTIASTSKKRDASFEVMQYLLSDEFQTDKMERMALYVSPLRSDSVRQSFGKKATGYAGKNVQAFVFGKPAPISPQSKPQSKYYNMATTGLATDVLNGVVVSNKDINTALRELEEKIAKQMKEDQAK